MSACVVDPNLDCICQPTEGMPCPGVVELLAEIKRLNTIRVRLSEDSQAHLDRAKVAEAALSERIESHKVCLDMMHELRERNIKNGKTIAALFALLNERGWTDDDIDHALAAREKKE